MRHKQRGESRRPTAGARSWVRAAQGRRSVLGECGTIQANERPLVCIPEKRMIGGMRSCRHRSIPTFAFPSPPTPDANHTYLQRQAQDEGCPRIGWPNRQAGSLWSGCNRKQQQVCGWLAVMGVDNMLKPGHMRLPVCNASAGLLCIFLPVSPAQPADLPAQLFTPPQVLNGRGKRLMLHLKSPTSVLHSAP